MTKEIEKLKRKLNEEIFDQERKKVRYDAYVIVVEGHRKQLTDLVEQSQIMMNELIDSGQKVKELNNKLKDLEDQQSNESE